MFETTNQWCTYTALLLYPNIRTFGVHPHVAASLRTLFLYILAAYLATIWLFNIVMENPPIFNRWTIYFYGPSPWQTVSHNQMLHVGLRIYPVNIDGSIIFAALHPNLARKTDGSRRFTKVITFWLVNPLIYIYILWQSREKPQARRFEHVKCTWVIIKCTEDHQILDIRFPHHSPPGFHMFFQGQVPTHSVGWPIHIARRS